MAKVLVNGKVGASDADYSVEVADGELKVSVGYPVAELLAPVKAQFFDKLKDAIPGSWDDAVLDKVWDELVSLLSE